MVKKTLKLSITATILALNFTTINYPHSTFAMLDKPHFYFNEPSEEYNNIDKFLESYVSLMVESAYKNYNYPDKLYFIDSENKKSEIKINKQYSADECYNTQKKVTALYGRDGHKVDLN